MNEKMRELCKIVGAEPELMRHARMSADEILACINCAVDNESGEIIDLDTGNYTGIWFLDVEY